MKKSIVLVLLLALFCAMICGCTPKESENGQTEPNISLPELQTETGSIPQPAETSEITAFTEARGEETDERTSEDSIEITSEESVEMPSEQETQEYNLVTEPSEPENTANSSEPSVPSVSEYDDDPEMETATDLVIDGGDGFGIGGN